MNEIGSVAPPPATARQLTGRMLAAVILGLAIWNLIVSVMDFVVVPWLGDLLGPGSTLPLSFTQRPYDYPDLFVSLIEFCVAAIVAISINWFFHGPGKPVRVKIVKRTSSVPRPEAAPVATQVTQPQPVAPLVSTPPPPPVATPPVPIPTPTPRLAVQPASVAPPPTAAKPTAPPPPPPPKPAKPQSPKEVQYNIVGEPLPPEED